MYVEVGLAPGQGRCLRLAAGTKEVRARMWPGMKKHSTRKNKPESMQAAQGTVPGASSAPQQQQGVDKALALLDELERSGEGVFDKLCVHDDD